LSRGCSIGADLPLSGGPFCFPVEPEESSFARAHACMSSMNREYWKTALREALVELDSARGKAVTDAAARRVMRARTELKLLGAPKRPKRATRGSGRAGASS
jgi:hypothetical protein